MTFGIPYQGSKSRIAAGIINILPPAETFVDLFAGGCAITHAAILSGKYEKFIVNDIGDAPQVFINAIKGEYNNENRRISREQFFAEKEQDPFIKYIWSFGNNGRDYICGKGKESTRYYPRTKRVKRLYNLIDTSKIDVQKLDYKNVEIPSNAIVYCDPPYLGARGYSRTGRNTFDSASFYQWAFGQDKPVFFSEYNAPDCFHCVYSKEVRSLFSHTNNSTIKVEKLFCNDVAYELIKAERIDVWDKI